MAINYSAFLTQVRNYTEVDSSVLSDTLLDQFITNTELDIAGKVDYDDLRKYSTSTFTQNNKYLSCPDDYIIARNLEVIVAGVVYYLEKRDQSFIMEYNSDSDTGIPKFWANWDDSTILVAPIPAQAYTVQLDYIKYPPHFTSTNSTYLSQYQQAMLLYGVLVECFSYLKGPIDMYNLYKSKYDDELQAKA